MSIPRAITIVIAGEPVAKARPRISANSGHVRAYTPRKTEAWEAGAALQIRAASRGITLTGALSASITIVRKRPKRLGASNQGRLLAQTRPDLDNYIKCVLDAAQRSGIFADDGAIVTVCASKWYAAQDENPHVEMTLEEIMQ